MSTRSELWAKYGGANREAAIKRADQRLVTGQKKRQAEYDVAWVAKNKSRIQQNRIAVAQQRATKREERNNPEVAKLHYVSNPHSSFYDPEYTRYTQMDSGITDPTYRWINDPQFRSDAARYGVQATTPDRPELAGNQEQAQAWLQANGDPSWASLTAANYNMMDEAERELYRYHYAKGGAEQANAYLQTIAGELNLRKAASEFEDIQGKTGREILSGIGAGFDQYARGLSGLTSKTAKPTSAAQYKSQMVRQDLADNGPKLPDWMGGASLGQITYDAVTTTANMAPSILASSLANMVAPGAGAWVGSGTMGAGAAGNARQEALAQGYSNKQATAYGILVGGAEMAMEKLLGGISAFGGGGAKRIADKLTKGKLTAALNSVDNVFLQIAAKLGNSALSEGSEEYVQELLDPVLRNLVLGEDNEIGLYSPEALYSGLLGALTGGILEGPNAIVDGAIAAGEARIRNQIRNQQKTEYLDAMQPDIDEAAELLSALDIEDDTLASAIAKTLWGQELTRKERKALEASEAGQNVLDKMYGQKHYPAEETVSSAEPDADQDEEAAVAPTTAERAAGPEAAANLQRNEENTTVSAAQVPIPVGERAAQESGVALAAEPAVETVEESTPAAADSGAEAESEVPVRTIEEVAGEYGTQAKAVTELYRDGQDVEGFASAVRAAWEMGGSGIPMERVNSSPRTQGITAHQRNQAYLLGQGAARVAAQSQGTANAKKATGGTVRRKGVCKAQGGITIGELAKTFNDRQRSAYKLLSFYAETTGVDVVLYKGSHSEESGRFAHGEDTIYIDITAGTNGWDVTDLGAYTMMRTFSHEFVHFVEKWSPEQYDNLREAVFAEMEKNGQNAEELVELAMQEQGLSFDQASREVVAEALTDILPDSQFVQTLANKHKTLFEKVKERLEAFVADLKDHWKKLTGNSSREAVALKNQVGDALEYAEEIVQLFDKAAGEAVEAYQAAVSQSGDDKLLDLISRVMDGSASPNERYEFGMAPQRMADEIKRITGADVSGYRVAIEARQIEHILKDHGPNGTSDRSMADPNDIAKIWDVMMYPDSVRDGGTTRAYVTSKDGRNRPASTVLYEQIYGGGNSSYVVQAVPETKKKTLFVVTAFRGKSGYKSGTLQSADALSPSATPGHESAGVPDSSVPDSEQNVNQKSTAPQFDEAMVSVTDERFTVSPTNGGGLIVGFKKKAPDAVRQVLKDRGFKWKPKGKHWEGKGDKNEVAEALWDAYEAERVPEAAPKARETVPTVEMEGATPSEKLANAILDGYLKRDKVIDAQTLYRLADEAFGGTQGQGAYDRKDAYDAMELAVNKYLLDYARDMNGDVTKAMQSVRKLEELLRFLPTQTVRTQEQQDFQQFSTPPNIAYLAAWAGNVQPGELVLEPSAGIGGIAVFAKSWGAEVTVNELSKRRLGILERMGFDHIFNENAEQLDNVLPDSIRPSLVLMNPPFSSTAGRTAHNKTSNAERHIDQALARLAGGGRLVAVLGKGMNDKDYHKYWDKVRKTYSIRANLSIDGSNYKKYGTTWGVQLVVIDKVGPQTGQTVTGSFTDLTQVPGIMEEIRNDRKAVERAGTDGGAHSDRMAGADGGNAVSEVGSERGRVGDPGKPARSVGKRSAASNEGGRGVRDRADDGGLRKSGADSGRGEVGRDVRADLRPDRGADHESSLAGELARPESQRARRLNEPEQREDDGVYATFVIPEVPIPGGKKHPATLVESAAMAAVPMPKATYTPTLPAEVVRNNLSDAQMVTVTYAGQAHEQMLPDGSRRGFFIGDGTGVGKGRQIAGIILDNFMQGRTKAVWVSKNSDLYGDAIRDWTGTTGRSKDEVLNHSRTKLNDAIKGDSGILFTTYPMLRSGKNNVTRLDQIVSWLGEDFDGVIAFDEAHNMGNLYGKKGSRGKSAGSEQAKAGVELQRRLPKARIVYVSATAATEVDNLAYAERLGLWGSGTAFSNAQDFISKIGSSGLAAMELVVRDMKAMGSCTARSISYQGVAYDTIEHTLDENQTHIYNTMSGAWQTVMQNIHKALDITGGNRNSKARANAMGQFYSSMQRFYNQVLTSMSMPSVISDIRKELAAGHSCVMQIVNTNEAQQEKALARAKADNLELDDLDLTPREALIGYLETSFPVQEFEEYTDDNGKTQSRPVVNSRGEPVISRQAVAMRDALIAEVESMAIPDGPMEMLFDAFGVEMVAENTGRSRRVVPKRQSDGSVKWVEERRSLNSRTADVQAFQDGKKRILVFSDAGGTGKSYHADRSEKNQQQRIHYVLQPGWSASNAVQGFGRTHRSNEASAPIYKLVTTNIKGQKRFTSTIARRLDQLGALTKGQRDTGSGMFGAKDNLETPLARDALREFYNRLGHNRLEGVDGGRTLERLGLKDKFYDEFGSFKMNEVTAREISTFLNRILALEVDEQNTVFDAFTGIYEMMLEEAIQKGTLDTGMENVKADRIEILDDKVIREDGNGGAATHYIQAKTYRKPKVTTTVAQAENQRQGFVGIYETDNGSIRAVYRMADKTTEWGKVVKQYRLVGPNQGAATTVWQEDTLTKRAKLLDRGKWQSAWDKEVAQVPEYNEDTMHMLTGALLPIWNSLPQEGSTKVKRLIASDGSTYLGRVVDSHQIDLILRQFQTSRTMEQFKPREVMDKALTGTTFRLERERAQIFRSRVSGEWRIEIGQMNDWQLKRYSGIMSERINYQTRYFIPNSEAGAKLLEELLKNNPIRDTGREDQLQVRRVALTDRQVLEMAAGRIDESKLTPAERDGFRIFSERLERLRTLQEDRTELGQLYKEQQFGPGGDRKAAAETLEKIHRLNAAIEAAADKVLEAEKGAALRKVLQEARKVVQKDQAAHDEAVLKEYRAKRNESAAQRKYRRAIQREVSTLREWLVHPDNKNALKHIPDVLKGPVASFLETIDLTSKSGGTQADERLAKKMQAVRDAYKRHIDDVGGLYSGYTDLPPDFMDRLTAMVEKTQEIALKGGADKHKINGGEMSAADLRALYRLVKEMKRHITTVNKFHANAVFQFASDAAQDTMKHLGKMGKAKNTALDGVDQFLFWKNIRPAYIFERFGKGGIAIYDGLRRGQGQLARNTKVITAFSKKAYKAEEVRDWEKEIKTVKLPGGDKIRLTTAQIMSLYCLSRREQAVPHLLGGGIRGANIKGTDTEATHLTMEDIQAITGRLTRRQRAVAEKLQKFMSEQGGEWGNAVTVKRFGERQFTEEFYFPINTDGQLRNAEADKPDGSDLYALLNMSFTKELTPNANNRVMLYSVFDVFANHMASMAQYNAMALPVLDALKWFNYRETWKTTDDKPAQDSVREQMVKAFGSPVSKEGVKDSRGYAETFVLNILRSYNGTEAQGTPNDGMGLKTLHHYNRAQVAYNVSVVAKQPLAILRAAQEIPYTAIAQGLAVTPQQRQQDIREMERYSGIAAWKGLGFYDVNISRGLTKLIKHNDTALDKYTEAGMKAAEWADKQTWGAIWHACKVQCNGNIEKTTALFENVIYKTQVVDSILTKTEYMRDKGFFSRLTSSFMSEPVTAVSPFLETAYRIKVDMNRRGGSFQSAWRKHGGKLGRYAYVYGVTAVVAAALQSVIDAWRDDDDYKTFWEKMMATLAGNIGEELNPFEKIPVVKEIGTIFSALGALVKGEDAWLQVSTLPMGDVAEYTVKATEILLDKVKGKDTGYTWYAVIRKYLQAASGMTGVPMATPIREAVDIWNNLVGRMAPSLKVKTYEAEPADELREAFLGGFVDEETATAKLIELGKAEDENEAYWKLRGWEGGADWNKYDALAQAMAAGEDISGEMDELTTHGVKEKTVRSQIRSIVGEWLQSGAITEAEARSLLVKYGERDSEEADETVMKWKCEIDTGIPFTGIKEAYLDGEITDTQAEQMYGKYGGYDQEKATAAVEKWRSEKETGTAYDDIADAVLDGEITEKQAAQMYADYGGYEAAEAQEMAHRLAFIRDNPGCRDISSAAVTDYEDHCRGVGISPQTFYDAWKKFNDTKSIKDENGKTVNAKRDQVMAQIDAMNLTAKQKDALYFAFGYAESKLWDTPWH